MKSTTRRAALPVIAAAFTSAIAARTYAATSEKILDQNTFPVFRTDLETLKESMKPFAARWWTVKYDGRKYHFCRENFPFFEVSRYDVHGWYESTDKRLFHVWSTRTHGIGDIRVDIDEAAGTVSLVALERKLKGKQVAFYALGAAAP